MSDRELCAVFYLHPPDEETPDPTVSGPTVSGPPVDGLVEFDAEDWVERRAGEAGLGTPRWLDRPWARRPGTERSGAPERWARALWFEDLWVTLRAYQLSYFRALVLEFPAAAVESRPEWFPPRPDGPLGRAFQDACVGLEPEAAFLTRTPPISIPELVVDVDEAVTNFQEYQFVRYGFALFYLDEGRARDLGRYLRPSDVRVAVGAGHLVSTTSTLGAAGTQKTGETT